MERADINNLRCPYLRFETWCRCHTVYWKTFTVEPTVSRLIGDVTGSISRGSCLGTYDLLGVRGAALESVSAGCRRTFLRLSFCASLLLRRFFSPGFKKKECLFTSLIMPSC